MMRCSGDVPEVLRDFDLTVPVWLDEAAQAVESGDAQGLLGYVCAGNTQWLAFVARNVNPLRRRGLYETALVAAWVGTRTNNRRLFSDVPWLLDFADRGRLRAAGDPLPGPGPFTVYRGVAGRGPARRVRGLSWTASLDVACWFAERLHLPDPVVYEISVDAGDVLVYTNGRQEEEFLIRVPSTCRPRRVAGTVAERQAGAARRVALTTKAFEEHKKRCR